MKVKFRKPNEMRPEKEGKVPVSARLRKSVRDRLQRMAEKEGLSLSYLLEQVIEDYTAWIEDK